MEDVRDDRPEVQELFTNLKNALPELEQLLAATSNHRGYEDPIYRFYHQSLKVYRLQLTTTDIVAALQKLAPDRKLNPLFMEIIEQGTGKTFEREHNRQWPVVTRAARRQ